MKRNRVLTLESKKKKSWQSSKEHLDNLLKAKASFEVFSGANPAVVVQTTAQTESASTPQTKAGNTWPTAAVLKAPQTEAVGLPNQQQQILHKQLL